jgi:hypothetical protein
VNKYLIATILSAALAAPAFADSTHDTTTTGDNSIGFGGDSRSTSSATGGAGGAGGAGGNASATGGKGGEGGTGIGLGGTSNVRNDNTNVGINGQDQHQRQQQGQAQGQKQSSSSVSGTQSSNNSTQASSNQSSTSVRVEGDTYNAPGSLKIRNTPDVFAPAIGMSAPCAVAASGGISVPGFGGSFGKAFIDTDCTVRETQRLDVETARVLASMGQAAMAAEVLCSNPRLRASAPKACAGSPGAQADAKVAEELASVEDPLIRARMAEAAKQ